MCGKNRSTMGSQMKYEQKSTDKRKEKSRNAAQDRRTKESQLFKELEDLLPRIPYASLDKTSLIRLTLVNLKCRNVVNKGLLLPAIKEEDDFMLSELEMQDCLEAFTLVMAQEMEVVFVSNNIEAQIGLQPLDIMGHTFYDYVHPCDHNQLKTLLSFEGGERKEVFVRIKVTVTESGRMINLRQANYKVLKISGIVRKLSSDRNGGLSGGVFLGLAQLIGTDALALNPEKFSRSGIFQTKHEVNMNFLETDPWLNTVGQYPFDYLLGMSFYEFMHVEDSQKVQMAFRNLFEQGQCETEPYKFLVGGGGWIWLQTTAEVVCVKKGSSKRNTVSCTHVAISEVMNRGDIVALVQIVPQKNTLKRKQTVKNIHMNNIQTKKVNPENIYIEKLNPTNVHFQKVNIENVNFQKVNVENVNYQNVNPLVTFDVIPAVKADEEIYSFSPALDDQVQATFQIGDEQINLRTTSQKWDKQARSQPTNNQQEEETCLTYLEDIGHKLRHPTPSVIVQTKNPVPKISTECLLRRSSVIVSSPTTIVHPDKESSSKNPQAVTNVLFNHADEHLDEKSTQAQKLVDVAPLDWEGCTLLEQLSPNASDDVVKFNNEDTLLFDFCDEPPEKKQKSTERDQQLDSSEDFFKIMAEINSAKENVQADLYTPSTIVHPDQIARGSNMESSSKNPQAVTYVLFNHAEKHLDEKKIYGSDINGGKLSSESTQAEKQLPPSASEEFFKIMAETNSAKENVPVDLYTEVETGEIFSLPTDWLTESLDLDGDLQQLSPSSSDKFVEVNLKDINLFDFADEPTEKKCKEGQNEQDKSEEFFKVLSETTLQKEDKLEKLNPYLDLESCFPDVYHEFNIAHGKPSPSYSTTNRFQRNTFQGKMPMVVNQIWQTLGENPPVQKPTNLFKMRNDATHTKVETPCTEKQTNSPKMDCNVSKSNRKRGLMEPNLPELQKLLQSQSFPSATPHVPELQKFLQNESFSNAATSYWGNTKNSRIIDNPKKVLSRNVILSYKTDYNHK